MAGVLEVGTSCESDIIDDTCVSSSVLVLGMLVTGGWLLLAVDDSID